MKYSVLAILIALAFTNVKKISAAELNPMPTVNVSANNFETINGFTMACHGDNGHIYITVSGGSPPYTYEWKNSAGTVVSTAEDLTSAPAGNYTVKLSKNGNSSTWSFTIIEPSVLNVSLEKSQHSGYNITQYGGSDGWIECHVQGGVPSYYYSWGETEYSGSLSAGSYSVTVTDENGCAKTLSTTLTQPPAPLQVTHSESSHHGYNVSCNGGHDGSIDLTITGGVTPYHYNWGNGVYIQDRDSLIAGNYTVIVDDDISGGQDTLHFTITQPNALTLSLNSPLFSNGFNTSTYNSSDGKIKSTVSGGVSPYTYLWNTGSTADSISGLAKGRDSVTVTDNNGCKIKSSIEITSTFEGWKIGGNLNIDTSLQFIGTQDNKDVVFKTNNQKRMTLTSAGTIVMNSPLKISSTTINDSTYRVVYAHADGTLDFSGGGVVPNADPCLNPVNPWYNIKYASCAGYDLDNVFTLIPNVGLGIKNPKQKLHLLGSVLIDASGSSLFFGNSNIGSDVKGQWGIQYLNDPNLSYARQGINIWKPGYNGQVDKNCVFYINNIGNVGIGVDVTQSSKHAILDDTLYRLSVNGAIRATKVKVYENWADYVFNEDYKLLSLDQLEKYITINNHLPGVKTAKEIEESGVDLGNTSVTLLEKIEELTLYVIQLKKENDVLKNRMEKLESNSLK